MKLMRMLLIYMHHRIDKKKRFQIEKSLGRCCYNENLITLQTCLTLTCHAQLEKLCKSCTTDGWVSRKRTHCTFLWATFIFSTVNNENYKAFYFFSANEL